MRLQVKNPRVFIGFSRRFYTFLVFCIFAFTLFFTTSLEADPINMSVYENTNDVNTSGLNLWMDVSDGGSFVTFTFHNDSTVNSSISNIYFESTALSSGALENGEIVLPQAAGVDFSSGATPPKPAGSIKKLGGDWNENLYWADAKNPAPQWGINPGESLSIKFDYKDGMNFQNVNQLLDGHDFRIAQHVKSVDGLSSVWTTNLSQVPLPTTLAILVPGFLAILSKRRIR